MSRPGRSRSSCIVSAVRRRRGLRGSCALSASSHASRVNPPRYPPTPRTAAVAWERKLATVALSTGGERLRLGPYGRCGCWTLQAAAACMRHTFARRTRTWPSRWQTCRRWAARGPREDSSPKISVASTSTCSGKTGRSVTTCTSSRMCFTTGARPSHLTCSRRPMPPFPKAASSSSTKCCSPRPSRALGICTTTCSPPCRPTPPSLPSRGGAARRFRATRSAPWCRRALGCTC
mmetsp:Transcript_17348/g.33738  ORF Transcript_17348/g.33738 Transcript_17348/m.33738 type:complete len:234 (+) Transcript_17348:74-775(+)